MVENSPIFEGEKKEIRKTSEQIREERRVNIDGIIYRKDLGENAFQVAMADLILTTLSFAPITVNRGNHEIVRDTQVLMALFAEVLAGKNKFAYYIPTEYGIRDKMSELFRDAYRDKFCIEIGPEKKATLEEVQAVIDNSNSQT